MTFDSMAGVPRLAEEQLDRIRLLCYSSKILKETIELVEEEGEYNIADIPWGRVSELKDNKPELLFEIFRVEPTNMRGVIHALVGAIDEHE